MKFCQMKIAFTKAIKGSIFLKLFAVGIYQVISLPSASYATYLPIPIERQQQEIMGVVRDANGQALPGVTILEKGTTNGTTTNEGGKYSIRVASSQAVLVFRSMGFVEREVPVANRNEINISLAENAAQLEQVVVVGYGSQRKKDLTGAVGTVKTEEIKGLPVPSLSDAVQGRVAGVQVVASGTPGSDATFRVRGTSTMNNNNPLLVIDGVPVMSGLNSINPDDIESMQVLKDASAAAVYGSRGANGVVIITTKRGKGLSNQLNVNAFTAWQNATNMVKMLNASQFAELHNEMMSANNQALNPEFANPSTLGVGTDWLDNIFRTAPMQNYSISYTGNSENANYYVSANILDQKGIVNNTAYKRYTLQFNSDHKLFDRLTFGNSLTLNHDLKPQNAYNIRETMAALPTQAIYNEDGTYAGPIGPANWVGNIRNPVGVNNLVENNTKGYNIIGNIYGSWEIIDHLTFKSTGGLQANFWDDRTWSPAYSWSPTPEPYSFLSQGSNKALTWLWDNTLTYDNYFNEVHHVTALLGTSAQNNRFDTMFGSVQGFASDVTQQLSNGIMPPTLGGTANEWALMSYIGRVNYDYNGKYLVTATIRRDGSSRFGPENKYGTFPSVSGAWRLSEEAFLKDVAFLNDLKLRAGYGQTGNQEIGNYTFAAVLNTGQYNFNGNLVPTVTPDAMPNPFVRWEAVAQSNIGIDASLFQDRLSITLDAYLKNTEDMLVQQVVPISTGYSGDRPYVNIGAMQNKGLELTITSQNLKGTLDWNTNFNVSLNQNKIKRLDGNVPIPANGIGLNQFLSLQQVGMPVGSFYGFVTDGIFQTQQEIDDHAVQVPGQDPFNRTSPGDIRFLDMNNNGVIDDDDRAIIGNPNPKYIFAMNNSLSYKGIDFSLFLQGVAKVDIYNANLAWQEGMAVAENQTIAVLDRWTGPGTSNTMPRAIFNDPNKNTRVSDRFIEDGSYLRIKNVTLGYTFPASLTNRIGVGSLRLYTSAQNLLTITNYSGFDPEVGVGGIDNGVYPVTRTISVGLNVGFTK
ncbi:SusC/RagA family TonB-linked outer membrane protein [Olivibacter sitiensis]|uniref:SusC/RagA family TonB-linked outer membrane protein n=1 Tax=Olivibacter sitiensis TaxID=376470 RepID=UPI0004177676|nr:TonB-dependent receptor [Olivibacter sitiensis]